MRKALLFALILYSFDSAFGAIHSLRYVYTGTSGMPDFPEFTVVGLVDGERFVYYDSNTRRMVPRQDWIAKSEGAEYWDRQTQNLIGAEPVYKGNIETAKKRFNQTDGIHTIQRMYGCEWDEETRTTGGHSQIGYDGNDFIALDLKTMSWVAAVPQAVLTKDKWNRDTAFIENDRNYFNQECIEWLKKYVGYGRETLTRKVPPEVFLLQKDSPSQLTCQVTGFYPNGIIVNWQKDGEDVYEDVESTGLLPNGDGTLQTRRILRVSPEDLKNHRYSCVVDHLTLKEKMVKTWAPESNLLPAIIGCVAVALLLVAAAAGFFVWKKRSRGYGKTNTSDTDSENSGPQAAKA